MQAPDEPLSLERVERGVAAFEAALALFSARVRTCTATAQAYLAALKLRNDAIQDLHSNLERGGSPAQYSERDRNILDTQNAHVRLCIAAAIDLKNAHAAVFADLLAAEIDFDGARESASFDVSAALLIRIVPDADMPRFLRMLADLAAPLHGDTLRRLNGLLRDIHVREQFAPRDRVATPSVASYRCTRYAESDWSSVYRGPDASLADNPAYADLADAAESLARVLLARGVPSSPAPPFHMRARYDRYALADPRERLRRSNPRLHALAARVAHVAALATHDATCAVAALRVVVEFMPESALVRSCAKHAQEMRLVRDLRLCALRCLAHSATLAAPSSTSSASSALYVQ